MQELGAGDLRQADRGDVAGVAAELLVHLLVDALRLERHLIVVRLAEHVQLAVLALVRPGAAVRERTRRLHLLGDLDEQLERRLGVRHDAVVRIEHPADLGRLDVHVHEPAALGVGVERAGVPVGPAIADAEHEVRLEEVGVAVAVAGLQADHAGHQLMVVGDAAPAHQGRDHRHARHFRELDQQVAGIGVDDPAAGDDQRMLGLVQHRHRLLDLTAAGLGLVDRERLIGVEVELDLGRLHVDRQIDQHRARAGPSA